MSVIENILILLVFLGLVDISDITVYEQFIYSFQRNESSEANRYANLYSNFFQYQLLVYAFVELLCLYVSVILKKFRLYNNTALY